LPSVHECLCASAKALTWADLAAANARESAVALQLTELPPELVLTFQLSLPAETSDFVGEVHTLIQIIARLLDATLTMSTD
jgi:hypothetical protein